ALLGRGRVPIGEALTILRAIAKALDAAHATGIAHRDLKAENIFLARDTDGGVFPKLLDFGIAKLLGPEDTLKHKTRTGAPIGTPYYMSPEQCRGRDVDHRTDLYAFGVLAYLMLTGTYPFDADSYMSILMKQISDQPAAPSTLAAELPSQIDDVIGWLMAKEPAQRPPDLRTAMRALDQAASSAGLIGPLPTSSMDAQSGAPSSSQGAIAVPRFSSSTSVPPADPLLVPPRRSRLLLIVGAIVAMGVIVAVVALVAWPAATSTPTPQALPEPPSPPDPIRPVAAPPPAPVAAPPIVEQPQTVIITITGVPDGTEVFAGGMTVGAAPGPVQLPRAAESTVLTFKADGYLAVSKSVIPDRDRSIAVELKKKSGSRSKRNTKNDILDPFGAKR
ncbi:MAG: serine/threonine protein kinase, partial [Kofleriaceae bacterium]